MTQEEVKDKAPEKDEGKVVDDPDYTVLGTKLPSEMADGIQKMLNRKRKETEMAHEIMLDAQAAAEELFTALWGKMKPIPEDASEDDRAMLVAHNSTFIEAASALIAARGSVALWPIMGSQAFEKMEDLIRSGVDAFFMESLEGKFTGQVLQMPEGYAARIKDIKAL